MTIGAQRNEVGFRINFMTFPHVRQGLDMMDVDQPFEFFAIKLSKVKATNSTFCVVNSNALFPCERIALVGIYKDLLYRAFC